MEPYGNRDPGLMLVDCFVLWSLTSSPVFIGTFSSVSCWWPVIVEHESLTIWSQAIMCYLCIYWQTAEQCLALCMYSFPPSQSCPAVLSVDQLSFHFLGPGRSFCLCSPGPWTITAMIIIGSTEYGTYVVSAVLSCIYFSSRLSQDRLKKRDSGRYSAHVYTFSARCMFAYGCPLLGRKTGLA